MEIEISRFSKKISSDISYKHFFPLKRKCGKNSFIQTIVRRNGKLRITTIDVYDGRLSDEKKFRNLWSYGKVTLFYKDIIKTIASFSIPLMEKAFKIFEGIEIVEHPHTQRLSRDLFYKDVAIDVKKNGNEKKLFGGIFPQKIIKCYVSSEFSSFNEETVSMIIDNYPLIVRGTKIYKYVEYNTYPLTSYRKIIQLLIDKKILDREKIQRLVERDIIFYYSKQMLIREFLK